MQKEIKILKIECDGVNYVVRESDVVTVLEALASREIKKDEIMELLKKFHLICEDFLDEIAINRE